MTFYGKLARLWIHNSECQFSSPIQDRYLIYNSRGQVVNVQVAPVVTYSDLIAKYLIYKDCASLILVTNLNQFILID